MAMHPYSRICKGEYTPCSSRNVFIKDNMIFDSGGTEVKESYYMVNVIDCLDVDNKVELPIRVFYDIDETVKELKSVE